METRAQRAAAALSRLKSLSAGDARRAQAEDEWLRIATPGEVRRNWRTWMGPLPAFARP